MGVSINPNVQTNVNPKDLFKELSLKDQQIAVDINIPDSFYQTMLEQLLERDYLTDTAGKTFLNPNKKYSKNIQWLQITRLPIHPNENQNYDLLTRWQGVLSSLHAWGYRLYFLLLRNEGQTKLYLGTISAKQTVSAEEALEQLREAAFGSMPGMELVSFKERENVLDEIYTPLREKMNSIGAVTGIPSFKEGDSKEILQTLDQLAFGIRDVNGYEKNYAMLVISDPIDDNETANMISKYRHLSSQIHSAVKMTSGQTATKSEAYDPAGMERAKKGLWGTLIGGIAGAFIGNLGAGTMIGSQIANTLTASMSHEVSVSGSANIGYEHLDKFAEFAEAVTEHHIQRLNEGRNFGFWNTGIYVLGEMPRDVVTVTGMLRSIYSGESTYFEPIRLHLFDDRSNALEIVRNNFDLIPLADASEDRFLKSTSPLDEPWHPFGKNYQYLSTPLNTRELSLATSLPRRDVPGIRFVRTAVRFANNPAKVAKDRITIGNIVDTGVVQNTTYDIDVNSLVRHTLVSGSTGSGKSTTCKKIVSEIIGRHIPVLIVEPAKDDYVRWALEMNKTLPEDKQFKIYMPGINEFEGHKIEELKLNLFEPAAVPGAKMDLLQRAEIIATLMNACLPSEEIVPVLLEETILETIKDFAEASKRDFESGAVDPLEKYPTIAELLAHANSLMAQKEYEPRVKENLKEVLNARFESLKRGTRGRILNVCKSVNFDDLFGKNAVINLSRLSRPKDKSLIMSVLMQALYEYRVSCYTHDASYRQSAMQNKLLHLALIEEAHNVLLKPHDSSSSGEAQQAAADIFGNMLSEVRGYGQGFMIVDQVPTRLIADATKNTNYKIVHRLTAPDDQEVMASCMAFREDQKHIIPALERGNAIICGDEDDAAAWVKIPKI